MYYLEDFSKKPGYSTTLSASIRHEKTCVYNYLLVFTLIRYIVLSGLKYSTNKLYFPVMLMTMLKLIASWKILNRENYEYVLHLYIISNYQEDYEHCHMIHLLYILMQKNKYILYFISCAFVLRSFFYIFIFIFYYIFLYIYILSIFILFLSRGVTQN